LGLEPRCTAAAVVGSSTDSRNAQAWGSVRLPQSDPSFSDTVEGLSTAAPGFHSKSRLEDMLGNEVSCFAYPYGHVDARIRAAVADAGYRFALTANPGRNLWVIGSH